MKRSCFILLLVSLFSVQGLALPLQNPLSPALLKRGFFLGYNQTECCNFLDCIGLRVGFYGDYVFERHMEKVHTNGHIRDTEMYTNAGIVTLTFWDRVAVFATLGATEFRAEAPGGNFITIFPGRITISSDTGFSWSVGGQALLLKLGCFGVGIEGQYFRSHPHVNNAFREHIGSIYYNNEFVDIREYQVGLGAAYQIYACCERSFIPYAGFQWNECRVGFDNILILGLPVDDFKEDRRFGFSLGLTYAQWGMGEITLEGRFINETALHVNVQFRF